MKPKEKEKKEKMMRIAMTLWELDDICSIDDKMISHWEYDIPKEDMKNFLRELKELCEEYQADKRLLNGKNLV